MVCANCGRQLTDAATALGYCPSCGALLDSPGEQPMKVTIHANMEAAHPVIQAARSQLTGNDALPPPPQLPPDPVSPYRPQINSSPPPPPATGKSIPGGPGTVATPQRGRGGSLITITLALLGILAVTGLVFLGHNGTGPLAALAGGSPAKATTRPTVAPTATTVPPTATSVPATATPVPTVPPPAAGFSQFLSTDGLFGLDYPSTWTTSELTPTDTTIGFAFTANTGGEKALAYDFSTAQDPSTLTSDVTNVAISLNGTNVTITQSATQMNLGNYTWTSVEATYQGSSNTAMTIIGLLTNVNGHGYLYLYTAPSSTFDTATGGKFDVMVNSFTVLH